MLESRQLLSSDPLISEFMASNSSTLADYYGKYPDWLEIYNPGTGAVNLSGWQLQKNSTSYTIPSGTTIGAGGYLVVFCDSKNTVAPNGELHTNFKLGADGDYLALLNLDGTVVSEYDYPEQISDVSYGVSTSLVGAGSTTRVYVPTDDSLGSDWLDSSATFDDSDWTSGTIGAGYGLYTPEGNANLKLRITTDTASDLLNAVNDVSPANHDGTNVGNSVSWVDVSTDASAQPIQRHGVMQFNASENDQITVSPNSDFYTATTGTISFWMNSSGTTGTGDGAVLMDMRSSRGMLITQTDGGYIRVRCYYNSTAVNNILSTATVSDGQWHLVTVNFAQTSGGTCSVYIDGALSASGNNSASWSWTTTYAMEIGRCTITSHTPALTLKNYNGLLDDFRFYNAQLNASQITNIYNGVDVGISTGDVGLNVQGLMQNVNTTAYIRIPFNVTTPSAITTLTLTMRYNDGFSAWINGHLVASANAPASLAWDSGATVHSMEGYQTFTITVTPGMLVAGQNILAIQGLNYALGDGNFLILPQLNADVITSGGGLYFLTPTPGAANSAGKTDLGPYVTDVTNQVAQPTGGSSSQPLTITATVDPSLRAVSTVQLAYRIMYDSETLVAMYDDGTNGDATAGDHIYTALISTTSLSAGQMLRWRVIATDTNGAITTGPAYNDPTNSEQYYGTVAVSDVETQLPMVQFFVQNYVSPTSTSDQTTCDTDAGARGAIYYNGEFYDNVLIKIKGYTSRYLYKRSHAVKFNSDHKFLYEEGSPRISEASFNAEYCDPSYARQYLSYWLHTVTGTGNTPDFPVRMEMNGEFWQLACFVVPLDDDILNVMGYDTNGALYKFCGQVSNDSESFDGSLEKKTRTWEGNSDLNALKQAINNDKSPEERAIAVCDLLDLPQVINYIAVARIVMECDDVWANMCLYCDSDGDGLWRIIPYDMNLSFGQMYAGEYSANKGIHANDDYLKAHPLYGGSEYQVIYHSDFFDFNQIYDAIISNPTTREMLLRRMRTIMDEYLQPPGTPYENLTLENMLDEFYAKCETEAILDKAKWGWATSYGAYGLGTPTTEEAIEDIKTEFLAVRREHLYVDHSLNTSYPGYANIPAAQEDGLIINFGAYDACPTSGNQGEEYLALVNNNDVAVDISGWKLAGGIDFTFTSGTVIPAGGMLYVVKDIVAFKARTIGPAGGQGLFIVGGYDGHLSLQGEDIQLLNSSNTVVSSLSWTGSPSLAQQYLRVTEIMYHPADPPSGSTYENDDFEYVELTNISTTQLDLTGVRFTDGPVFDFTGGNFTKLDPGAKVLIVSNWDAFHERYGTGLDGIIAGEYGVVTKTILDPTHLSNSGEKITLVDALGETILGFTYKDGWYKQTDGPGNSLVIRDAAATDRDLWDRREGWFASNTAAGSPGSDETTAYAADVIVVNELLAHRTDTTADWVEFYNTTGTRINIGGWYISNDDSDLKKYLIPANTYIEADGYSIFSADAMGFTFGELGGTVYLTSASSGVLTTYQVSEDFGASNTGVTLGRYIKSTGGKDFVAMDHATPGDLNSDPLVGPVVINEIYYHPDTGGFSFIELKNITGSEVLLYDSAATENTWKLTEGISFTFPEGASIAAYGYCLIVDCDPEFFREKYNVPESVPIYGPFVGNLNNAGDTVELKYPGEVQPDGDVPYYRVDQVTYEDSGSWSTLADGKGASLNRISATAYGNDATNWTAGYPTPGADYAVFNPNPITIITPAAASPSTVTGTTANLSVSATDIEGESSIIYNWSATLMPVGATYPTFSDNNTNSAKNATVTFYKAGNYTFTVTLADVYGGVITSSVNVTVIRTLTDVTITPAASTVVPGDSIQFSVYGIDQFGDPIGTPLSNITWSVYSGVGSISPDGLYTAPVGGSGVATVRAITSTGQILYANATLLTEAVWYPANETSGTTLADASGNGNDATLSGAAAFATGISGNALYLTGGYAFLPTGVVSTLTDFTIALWVKIDTLSTWSRIFDFGTGTTVNMFLTPRSGSGAVRFAITTSGNGSEQQINGAAALATGTWQHVAVTLSGATGTLYVNGVAVGANTNMTLSPSSLGSTTQNYLGKSQYADPALMGSIDDFRIIAGALSAADVADLYNAYSGSPSVPAPVSYWKLDGDGTDSSGNGNTLTLYGSPAAYTGMVGSCLTFTGSQYAYTSGTAFDTALGFSVSAWVFWDGTPGYWTMVSADGATDSTFFFQKRSGGSFALVGDNGSGTQAYAAWSTRPLGYTWYYLTGVYTGSLLKLYVNGALVASTSFSSVGTPTGSFIVGASKYGGSRTDYFRGMIDEVQIFDTALSDEMVAVLYKSYSVIPAGWTDNNIGSPAYNGSAISSDGATWTVTGAGYSIGGRYDQCNYVWQTLSSNGAIVAQVDSLATYINDQSKAGLMIRSSLVCSTMSAGIYVTAGGDTVFVGRNEDSETALTASVGGDPRWLKLVRLDSYVTAYYSSDGSAWTQLGSAVYVGGNDVYIGMAVSSHDPDKICNALFTDVEIDLYPTDIALSASTVAENLSSGTTVGTFSTTDPNSGATFIYTLVNGDGASDNASFTISGNELKTAALFDYETKNTYSARVRTTDNNGYWYEEALVISVTDQAEAITIVSSDWTDAGLTLTLGTDGKLHFYRTGSTTDAVAAHNPAKVTGISVTGRGTSDVLTYSYTGEYATLDIYDTSVIIAQDNAISAATAVTIDGGALDLNGKTDTVASLLLISGSVTNGILSVGACTIQSGTISAAITGAGTLAKNTNAQAAATTINNASTAINQGTLTVDSIFSGTLTIGAGATLTIAAIPGGPSADGGLTPLAADAVQTITIESDSQPAALAETAEQSSATIESAVVEESPAAVQTALAEVVVQSPPVVESATEEAEIAASIVSAAPLSESLASIIPAAQLAECPVFYVDKNGTAPISAAMESVARLKPADAAVNRALIDSPTDAMTDSPALFAIAEILSQEIMVIKQAWETRITTLTSSRHEPLVAADMSDKRASASAVNNRLAHSAALQTIISNPNRSGNDTDAVLDFVRHARAGKQASQLQTILDRILAEEEDAFLLIE
jgi:hypothetical protein